MDFRLYPHAREEVSILGHWGCTGGLYTYGQVPAGSSLHYTASERLMRSINASEHSTLLLIRSNMVSYFCVMSMVITSSGAGAWLGCACTIVTFTWLELLSSLPASLARYSCAARSFLSSCARVL